MKAMNQKIPEQWLEPLNLSNGIILPHRIMPGPLHGVMNPLFCRTMNELNIFDYWITPFIQLSTAPPKLKTLSKKISIYLAGFKPGRHLIVQLLGSDADIISETAFRLQQLNAVGVNLNFACPSNKVLKSGNGGALLQDVSKMREIILKIKEKVPKLSISVKVRSGYESSDEMNNFLPKLSDLPVDFIMFHFRTIKEKYTMVEKRIERIKKAVCLCGATPLIASGDIFTKTDAVQIGYLTKCDGICIARGLMNNPFLPLILKEEINEGNDQYNKRYFYNQMNNIAKSFPEYRGKRYFIEIAKMMWGINSKEFKSLNK